MKKAKKFFCTILTALMITSLSIPVFASTNSVDASNSKTITTPDYSVLATDKGILSKFPNMNNKDLKNGKLVGGKELYINQVETLDSKSGKVISTSKVRTKEDYQKSKITNLLSTNNITTQSIDASPSIHNSWMRITLNIYSSDNLNLDIYGYYEWLSSPFFHGYDVLGIAHDSHMTFNYASAWCDAVSTLGGGPGSAVPYKETWVHKTNTSSGFKGEIGGVAFTNKLIPGDGITGSTIIYPYGMMYVRAKKGNTGDTSAEIGLTYGHQQVGLQVSPSVSIPLGYTIRITSTATYDKYNLPYQINY